MDSCKSTCKTKKHQYIFVKQPAVYEDAVSHCKSLNGQLLTPDERTPWETLYHCFSCVQDKLWTGHDICKDHHIRCHSQMFSSGQSSNCVNVAFNFISLSAQQLADDLSNFGISESIYPCSYGIQLPYLCEIDTVSYFERNLNSNHLSSSEQHSTSTLSTDATTTGGASSHSSVPGAWIALLVIAGISGLITMAVYCFFRRNRHLKYKWVYSMDTNQLLREKRSTLSAKGSVKYLARAASQKQRAKSFSFHRTVEDTESNVIIEVGQQTYEESD